jgi:hypothetical protein
MRRLALWICGFGHTNRTNFTKCDQCGATRRERHAQVHASERAVIYQHPLTGERKTPPRADQPMPLEYARQGFERREILNMGAYERETGLVHEATNFTAGNEPSPSMDPVRPPTPPAVREALINDVRDAIASGPWTDDGADHSFAVAAPV